MTTRNTVIPRPAPAAGLFDDLAPTPASYARARWGEPESEEERALFKELDRLQAEIASSRGARRRILQDRFGALDRSVTRVRSGAKFWGAARPLVEHAARAYGQGGEAAAKTSRLMALLALPALCRRDGIEIRFSNPPRTDGRTIWLGAVDFAHPAAPVYVFGHGVHERCHVVHTAFDAMRGLDARTLALFNVFEDLRVDALGMSECHGYRLWREALIAMLCTSGRAVFSVTREDGPARVLLGWLLGEFEIEHLGLRLPDGVIGQLREEAAVRFGRDFMRELLGLVRARLPLADSFDAAQLAAEVAAVIDDRADLARRERETAEALGRPVGHGLPPQDRPEGAGRPPAVSGPNAFSGLQLELFSDEEWGSAAGLSPGAVSSGTAGGGGAPGCPEASEASEEDAGGDPSSLEALADPERWADAPRPDDGLDRLRESVELPEGEGVNPEAIRETYGRIVSEANRRGFTLERAAAAHMGTDPFDQRESRRAFDAAWAKTTDLGMRFSEALRRRIPNPVSGARIGWDVDDAVIDRALCGDDRIFLTEGREPGREAAVQLLLDTSGSLGTQGCAIIRAAAARLELAFKALSGVKCRTAVFPDPAGRLPWLASDWESPACMTRAMLRQVPARGPTPIGTSLLWSLFGLAQRREAVRLLILFTDGVFAPEKCRSELAALKLAGVEVAVVLLNEMGDRPENLAFGREARIVRRAEDVPLALLEIVRDWRRRNP